MLFCFVNPILDPKSDSFTFNINFFLFNFQEDLQVAVSQGGRLLDCIKEPIQTDPDYSMTYDEVENLATVQR